MDARPVEMADVEVVLTAACQGHNDAAVADIRRLGAEVDGLDDANGVVEATLPADRLPALKALACVAFVRSVFTYLADLPPGTT